MQLIPTIVSGGAGSRLWPVSRELHPKPFIRLADGYSLLQKTFLRSAQLTGVKEILSVTNRDLLFKTIDEFREVKQSDLSLSFILEPVRRNTAAAIVAAALRIEEVYDDAIMLVLPADHLISDQDAFANAVDEAIKFAADDQLVTFGIHPLGAETGYGYIEADGNKVLNFIEKPVLEKAQEYCASGRHFWNAGIFCFKASTLLQQMEEHCPAIPEATKACMRASHIAIGKDFTQIELDIHEFSQIPENSIDYALMEKSKQVAVVPCSIGWCDIGSWGALGDLTAPDSNGNRIEGEALLHDVKNCYIRGKERLIAAVGTDGLFIIDTPDALLVAEKSRAQDVKALYEQLKLQAHETQKLHRTVHRPWGTYTILETSARFKIKHIEVKPGACLSLQMHHHRSEHWVVVSGIAKVVNGDKEYFINTNESTYVPPGCKHRLENPGLTNLIMIEVQCGEYMGEDDIVRFEDIYGRA